MFYPKTILVPTDFSECDGSCSMMAVKTAVSLSQQYGSKIVFLHVIDDPYKKPLFFLDDSKIDEIIEKMKEASFEKLNKIVNDNAHNVRGNCKVVIKIGKPSKEIINKAEEINADLIVIASRGIGDVHATVFGSTTDKVIRRAKCSVLVSRKPNDYEK